MDKYCRAIELDKILNRLAQHCGCADSKDAALAIAPVHELRDAKRLLQLTVDEIGRAHV